jgi:hypothetical protein
VTTGGVADGTGDVEHRRRVRIPTVEDAGPRLRRDEPDELADVLGRGCVEVALASVREQHVRPAVERSLDEEPFARHPVVSTVDRTRAYDSCGDAVVFEEDALELDLLGRVRLVARLDSRLALGNRNREVRKVVDALGLIERPSLLVGVDRGARDRDDRARIEPQQLLGMRSFERDHVNDEIEAVRNIDCSVRVTVERDVIEAIHGRALVPTREGQLPAVAAERTRDGATDAAPPAENEGALRD